MTELLSGWLQSLKNAEYIGMTTQIGEALHAVPVENPVFLARLAELDTQLALLDDVYKKTQKDWNVEKLKTENEQMDSLMIGIRSILSGHAAMPANEPLRQPALEILQLWKDFRFKVCDSYSAESSKIINMSQEIEKREADALALGIWTYFQRARQHAISVQNILSQRLDELASRQAGQLRDARFSTDAAIKQMYLVLNSLQVLMPSSDITAVVTKLKTIENYARQYYLKNGISSTTIDTPTPSDPSGETNPDDPTTGGGNSGGGSLPPSGGTEDDPDDPNSGSGSDGGSGSGSGSGGNGGGLPGGLPGSGGSESDPEG